MPFKISFKKEQVLICLNGEKFFQGSSLPVINGEEPLFEKTQENEVLFRRGKISLSLDTLRRDNDIIVYKVKYDESAHIESISYLQGEINAQQIFLPRPPHFYYSLKGEVVLRTRQTYCCYFAPPPQIYCFKLRNGWIGIGLGGVYKIDGVVANFKDGFSLKMKTDMETKNFEFPELIFVEGESEWDVLENYTAYLKKRGVIKENNRFANWWTKAIYCTWGDQMENGINSVFKLGGNIIFWVTDNFPEGLVKTFTGKNPNFFPLNKFFSAPMSKTINKNFVNESIDKIKKEGWKIGTIILDDRWMKQHGLAEADEGKFDNFKKYIGYLHQQGYKVIAWYPVWWIDPESKTAQDNPEFLIKDRKGKLSPRLDITHPGAREHLKKVLYQWLSQDGYDMDGLKLDFNYDAPSLEDQVYDPSAGIGDELAMNLQKFIYECAHEAKDDALVISISPNPMVNQWADMIRLNDYFARDVDGQLIRARIALSLCPGTLIDADTYNHRNHYAKYIAYSSVFGVPDMYYIRTMGLKEGHYQCIKEILDLYDNVADLRGRVEIEDGRWQRIVEDKVVIETDGKIIKSGDKEIKVFE